MHTTIEEQGIEDIIHLSKVKKLKTQLRAKDVSVAGVATERPQ